MKLFKADYEIGKALPILQGDKMHWRKRASYRSKWHKRVHEMLLEANHWPLDDDGRRRIITRVRLTCVRFSSGQPDYDNLVASFKPVVDGFLEKHGGWLLDDNPQVIVRRHYGWSKCLPPKSHILLKWREERTK